MEKNLFRSFKLICIFFISFMLSVSPALSKEPGTTGFNFLKICTGARAAAMGNAYTAMADDVNAAYWNPAGLARLGHGEISFSHMEWIQETKLESLVLARRIQGLGVLGLSMSYLAMDNICGYDDNDIKTDYFSANNRALGFSWAFGLDGSCRYVLGINTKIIQEQLEEKTAMAYALDMGVAYEASDYASFGLTVQNLGTKVKFISEEEPLPVVFRAGSSINMKDIINISIDLVKPADNYFSANAGIEWIYQHVLAFRAGYKSGTTNAPDSYSGLTAGLGFNWEGWCIDYAWIPYGNLGTSHMMNLIVKFGQTVKERKLHLNKRAAAKKNFPLAMSWIEKKAEEEGLSFQEQILLFERLSMKYGHLTDTTRAKERVIRLRELISGYGERIQPEETPQDDAGQGLTEEDQREEPVSESMEDINEMYLKIKEEIQNELEMEDKIEE